MDGVSLLRFLAAFLFVLALIAVAAFLARKYGLGGRIGGKTRPGRRLHVIETLALDAKHRAVLIRRDAAEHLVILSEGDTTVVESGITGSPGSTANTETPR